MCMSVFPVCISVYHRHEVPLKTRGGHWITWDWKREVVGGGVEINPGSSGREPVLITTGLAL